MDKLPTEPDKSCVVDVDGSTMESLMAEARRQGAIFLGVPAEDLCANYITNPQVVQRSRYVQHLGKQIRPVRWRATVILCVSPISPPHDHDDEDGKSTGIRLVT